MVAPPSVHPDGGAYRWLSAPLGSSAMSPDWLLAELKPKPYIPPPPTGSPTGTGEFSLHCLVRLIETAPEGRRNNALYGACRDAAKQGDLEAFAPALVAAVVAQGLAPGEVEATVRSAGRAGR